jgi:hypothetical protein
MTWHSGTTKEIKIHKNMKKIRHRLTYDMQAKYTRSDGKRAKKNQLKNHNNAETWAK